MRIPLARAAQARRCWRSGGKVRFRSRADATLALARLRRAEINGPVPCRSYRCPWCGGDGWHLTSQERRERYAIHRTSNRCDRRHSGDQ